MMTFNRKIVQFGFGAVGKSFYEKVKKEIKFNENKYYVITANKEEFKDYVNLGGMIENFVTQEITKENFVQIFSKYLEEGDLLIDFADAVGTRDLCKWCAEQNIMYINTGEADWPENWYSILNENLKKQEIKKLYKNSTTANRHPIVLQHGNNPGLVSHFVKAGLEYIVNNQFKKDKELKTLIKSNKFNEVAQKLGLEMIHVNDLDLQKINEPYNENTLFNTWCIDSFFFELLSEATFNIGTHEKITYADKCKLVDMNNGFIEFNTLAINTKCKTVYPNGEFEGFLVPHEETITIAKSLEVKQNDEIIYKPSVMFIYSPCEYARKYFETAKVSENAIPIVRQVDEKEMLLNEDKGNNSENITKHSNNNSITPSNLQFNTEDREDENIIRGYRYPQNSKIVYKENIASGTEYVGVLILGNKFNPVWIGNRIEIPYLYKKEKDSYWQTPTITPVAMSALSAVCWMIKNKDNGGIYFPEDIADYKSIIKIAEKYISKTIYKTFDRQEIENTLKIDLNKLQGRDFFVL